MGYTQYLHFLIKNLSQGTRSKIYMAIMLSKRADVLLDEAFTALNQFSQAYFCDLIQKQNRQSGRTVVLVPHIAQFKQLATSKIEVVKKAVLKFDSYHYFRCSAGTFRRLHNGE